MEVIKNGRTIIIGIGGGSGVGKSTIAENLRDRLSGMTVDIVKLDRFFKPQHELPRYFSNHHGEYRPDYNTPVSLDVPAMTAWCEEISGPGIVILDGHYALFYPQIRAVMDVRCFVTAGIEEMLERRTSRNIAAGYGGDLETILNYNRECVVPRYREYIEPTIEYADIVIPNGADDGRERDLSIGRLCSKIDVISQLKGVIKCGETDSR